MFCFGISTLFYFFFDAQQVHFKLEAGQNIRSNTSLEIIKLPVNEFLKTNSGDELWVNGKLYDIKSYSVENGTASVTVYHDNNEEGLVKNLAESFTQDDKYTTDNSVHINKHRLHAPDDGKVLVAPYVFAYVSIEKVQLLFPPAEDACLLFVSGVVKPPPEGFII